VKRKGLFITFEGNEGCGKSTQIRLLYESLKEFDVKVFLTREPGGTRISDGIRAVLLDNKNKVMSKECETLLYMASRAQLVSEIIHPKLEQNYVVLCDRWLDATIAYQGYGENVDINWIIDLGNKVTQGIKPDLTIFLDLPLEVGLKRAKSHKLADRMEKKRLAFHKKVREGYLQIVNEEPYRFRKLSIASEDSIEAVHAKVKAIFTKFLDKNPGFLK
jgi:dTMP kinase